MKGDDKSKTDEVVEEAVEEKAADEKPAAEAAEEPEAEDKPAEEPEAQELKADKPAEDKAVSTDAAPAGVDQQGRQLYNVKCSNCGRDTQVPFKPSGDRPVYCRDCYMQKKNS
jgi:CxxC-x17-CxxC domain-containing protein